MVTDKPSKTYIYVGEYTQSSNIISMSVARGKRFKNMECNKVWPGQWRIWVRKKDDYIKEVVISHNCKNKGSEIYGEDNFNWTKPMTTKGPIMTMSDASQMTINIGEIVEIDGIGKFKQGFLIRKIVKNAKRSKMSVSIDNGRIAGVRIVYVKNKSGARIENK